MLNIVLFGPPGSGKGTQAEKLVEKYKLVHISTGDLLRSEVAAKSELGLRAKAIMDAGELVPDEIVIGMIRKKLDENKEGPGFIFDGFPRTVEQARELRKALTDYDERVTMVISLQVPREELMKRLLKRGEESGRSDDNEETINNRIDVYERQTIPVTYYYEKMHKHLPVEGIGTIDQIFDKIVKEIDQFESFTKPS
ncbi:MAG TPA: adenylate kinase [Bacteroidales bacterium]|nr:adenylate kinase [Bacteroidales bacterium]